MKRITESILLRIILILTVITLVLTLRPVYARPAYAVELISFTAVGITNGVELRWETATELGAAAFQLQRNQGAGFVGMVQLVDENGQPYAGGIIEAQGSPTFGALYIARDLTAVPGQTYTYQLIEVESSNQTTIIGTITVIAGGAPTPTQIIIGGNTTPVSGGQNTATSTNTAVTATSTPPSPAQATATATRTLITPSPAVAEEQTFQSISVENTGNSGTNVGADPPVAPPASTSSDILEIAQVESTPESGYPGQPTPSAAESGYPEAIVTPLTIDPTITPYPANNFLPETEPTPTIIGVVGSQTDDANTGNNPAQFGNTGQPATPSTSSVAILWLGFLAGMFIFIAAVIGSIVLFVRRRQ